MSVYYGSNKIKDIYFGMGKTNCLTYIPEDIKLELKDGVLTLKAGSKVYRANGVNSFKDVTLTSDYVIKNTWGSAASGMVFYGSSAYYYFAFERIHSGSTNPTGLSGNSHVNYNTTDGYFYFTIDKGTTWTKSTTACLPLACVTWDNDNKITSIDQVFNGFGFIGHTYYMLPNVKLLRSNGLNADGTYKNTEYIVPSVKVKTTTYNVPKGVLFSNGDALELGINSQVYEVENTLPTPANSYERVYVRSENQWYFHIAGATSWLESNIMCVLGKGEIINPQGVTYLTPNPVQTDNTSVPIRVIYNGSGLVYDKVISYENSSDFVGTKTGLDIWGTNEYHQISGRYDSGNYTDVMEFSEEQKKGNWKLSFYYFKQSNWNFSNFIISVTYEDDSTEEVYNSVELVNVNSVGTTKTIDVTMSKPWKTISIYASGGRSSNENSYGGTGKIKMTWRGTEQTID